MTPPQLVSVDPATAREVRMLTALLAGCDPCRHVTGGDSPDVYAGIALDAVRLLHRGTRVVDMLDVFPGEADASAVLQFARAAVDWWETASSARASALMTAAPARR